MSVRIDGAGTRVWMVTGRKLVGPGISQTLSSCAFGATESDARSNFQKQQEIMVRQQAEYGVDVTTYCDSELEFLEVAP